MIIKRLISFVLAVMVLFSFAACVPNYTQEFIAMNEAFDVMNKEWDALLAEEETMGEADLTFETIDQFYDKAIAHSDADLLELDDMVIALESYQKGLNEQNYEEFMEVLSDTINTVKAAIDYFTVDRGRVKAKVLFDGYNTIVNEWNALSNEDKNTALAESYLTNVLDLREKLDGIEDVVDAETYTELRGIFNDGIDVFNETISMLETTEE